MKLFISWSGELSQRVAGVLRRHLPCIIQGLEVFMSRHDLESGTRWSLQLAKELDDSNFGIICLTPDNLNNPWLLFEAGALTKYTDGRACGLLFGGVKPADIGGPLSQFQNRVFDKDEFGMLLVDMNDKLDHPLDNQHLSMVFEVWWPVIERDCKRELSQTHPVKNAVEHREQGDILNDILVKVRNIERTLEKPPGSSRRRPRTTRSTKFSDQDARAGFITLEVDSSFGYNEGEYHLSVSRERTVSSFLNEIYFILQPKVEPYTVGTAWALGDSDTGEILHNLESDWSRGTSGVDDTRTLEEVGIRPGMKLHPLHL